VRDQNFISLKFGIAVLLGAV